MGQRDKFEGGWTHLRPWGHFLILFIVFFLNLWVFFFKIYSNLHL